MSGGLKIYSSRKNDAGSARKDGNNGHKRNDVPGLVWKVKQRDNSKTGGAQPNGSDEIRDGGTSSGRTWDEGCFDGGWSGGSGEGELGFVFLDIGIFGWGLGDGCWVMGGKGQTASRFLLQANGRRGDPLVLGMGRVGGCSSRSRQKRAYHVFPVQDGPPIACDAARRGDA